MLGGNLLQRVVRLHRLPKEAVNALSLEVFKAKLDGALGILIWWVVALSWFFFFTSSLLSL